MVTIAVNPNPLPSFGDTKLAMRLRRTEARRNRRAYRQTRLAIAYQEQSGHEKGYCGRWEGDTYISPCSPNCGLS